MDAIEDPFGNVNMVEETEITRTNTGTGETSSTSEGSTTTTTGENLERETERRFSNTPQGSISNLDSFMTEATRENETDNRSGSNTGEDSSTTTATSKTNSTDTETYRHTRKGNHGVNTYAHDMKEYREIIVNIDMMIINDLNPLFLGVY